MELSSIPPDIDFERVPSTAAAIEEAFAIKIAAMRPHIERRWGWDEDLQRRIHHQRFSEKPFFWISRQSRIGTLSMQRGSDHIRFGEFYLLPEVQGKGLGSRVLQHCLDIADETLLPVRLEHLLWNPVGTLYRRFGFCETGRSDIHAFMERSPLS